MKPGLTVFDCEQGSPAWYQARLGLVTASQLHAVMASGRGGGESKTRRTYMLKLAGEILCGEPMENYTNAAMERGKVMEEEARNYYAFRHQSVELKRVGFIHDPAAACGCSPDAIVTEGKETGGLEIKTRSPHILIEDHLRGEMPPEFKAQLQGTMFVTGWKFVDLLIYYSKMKPLEMRIYRDDHYIRTIESEVRQFNRELAAVVAQMR